MTRKCQISGSASQSGNRVSHAKNSTRHVFKGNIQSKRIYCATQDRWLKLKLSTRIIRTIDKLGLSKTLKKYNLNIKDLS